MKASYIVQEVLDERRRVIYPNEYRWLISQFKDRYNPVRLAFCLGMNTGIRPYDAIRARFSWFNQDFTMMKMSQCKPHVSIKDGVTHLKSKPRLVPLGDSLSADLRAYVRFRLMVGVYAGEDLTDFRLFPTLKRWSILNWLAELRKRKGNEAPWMWDVWILLKGFSAEGKLLWTKKWYRVAAHAVRAYYNTAGYEESDKDPIKGKIVCGYEKLKDYERYIRVTGIMETRNRIKKNYIDTLCSVQKVPLLVGQKNLTDF